MRERERDSESGVWERGGGRELARKLIALARLKMCACKKMSKSPFYVLMYYGILRLRIPALIQFQ